MWTNSVKKKTLVRKLRVETERFKCNWSSGTMHGFGLTELVDNHNAY